MLHNLLIISSSGLVLYSREFSNNLAQPRLIGSLLTALTEFSKRNMALPVSHIELENFSVAVTVSESTRMICAVFIDKSDDLYFGRLISTELLFSFSQLYTEIADDSQKLDDFGEFSTRLPDVLVNCIGCVLNELKLNCFVDNAMLYRGDVLLASSCSCEGDPYLIILCSELLGVADELGRENKLLKKVSNMEGKLQRLFLETSVERNSNQIEKKVKQIAIYQLQHSLHLVLLSDCRLTESQNLKVEKAITTVEKSMKFPFPIL
eukprot:jgi/Galph1/6014/GphlegSOOS_G4750.1